jgi:hypothetical protein
VFTKKIFALRCIILISVEIIKKAECQNLKTPFGNPGLDSVLVRLAVVVVALDLTSPLYFHTQNVRHTVTALHTKFRSSNGASYL